MPQPRSSGGDHHCKGKDPDRARGPLPRSMVAAAAAAGPDGPRAPCPESTWRPGHPGLPNFTPSCCFTHTPKSFPSKARICRGRLLRYRQHEICYHSILFPYFERYTSDDLFHLDFNKMENFRAFIQVIRLLNNWSNNIKSFCILGDNKL